MNLIHPFGWGGPGGGAGREHILQTRLLQDKSAASCASLSTGLLRFPLRVGVSNIFLILFFIGTTAFHSSCGLGVSHVPSAGRGIGGG